MEFNSNLPIYMQIMDMLKMKIIRGEYKPGDKLLSVRDLSSNLKVNPNTVQRAYQELELELLVETKRGMGTFVTEDKEIIKRIKKSTAINIVEGFLDTIKGLSLTKEELLEIFKDSNFKDFTNDQVDVLVEKINK